MTDSGFIYTSKNNGLGLVSLREPRNNTGVVESSTSPQNPENTSRGIEPSNEKTIKILPTAQKPKPPKINVQPVTNVKPDPKPEKEVKTDTSELVVTTKPPANTAPQSGFFDFYTNNKKLVLIGGGIGGALLLFTLLK